MIYVVTRRLLAYYYADPVICYAFLGTMVGPITIVSTHSRPTPRLPVFILHTFYVFDVIWASVKLGDTLGMPIWLETINGISCCFGGYTDK